MLVGMRNTQLASSTVKSGVSHGRVVLRTRADPPQEGPRSTTVALVAEGPR